MSIEQVHYFWRHPPEKASPQRYLRSSNKPVQKYIAELINQFVDPSCKILEIGCNMGRNLNELWKIGFKKLSGVEINPEAIALMKITYPEMTDNIKIHTGPIEKIIKDFDENTFDACLARGILMHIHPDAEFIFAEIARITRFLITVEREYEIPTDKYKEIVWVRKYRLIFESLGLTQICQIIGKDHRIISSNNMIRVFRKDSI